MREYRARQKQAQQQIINTKATILQNAIRNKLARNALLQQKQNKANEVVSKINQEQSLINKLNAIVMTNDILTFLKNHIQLINVVPGALVSIAIQLEDQKEAKINMFKFFYI